MPSLGYFRLETLDKDHLVFESLFNSDAPTVTAGYGGWTTVQRPRRRSLTEWTGSEPLEVTIGFIIDDFAEGKSIEGSVRTLEKMAGLTHDGDEPPILKMTADGAIPHDYHDAPQNTWVIKDLSWAGSERNFYGNRTRQEGTLIMMLYVKDEHLERLSSAKKRKKATAKAKHNQKGGSKKSAPSRIYIVKKGDTLSKIAATQLHDASRWGDIADKNGLRDPNRIKVGQHLKMP